MSIRYLIPLLVLFVSDAASADTIVYDHFDDGIPDPAWEVTFNDLAYGWTYCPSCLFHPGMNSARSHKSFDFSTDE